MSRRHPIISITGSSGAGTTSVKKTFENIFRRENVKAAYIEGDAFHRYNREEMRRKLAQELDIGADVGALVLFLERIPRTSNGKVDRAALQRFFSSSATTLSCV